MHPTANIVCCIEIIFCRDAHSAAFDSPFQRRPLHDGHRLTGVKSQLRIQRQRPVVIGSLQQSNTWEGPFPRPIDYGLHQNPPNTLVLNLRSDRDRPDPRNRRPLIQAIATDDAPLGFRDYAVEARVGKEHPEKTHPGFRHRKFGSEIVLATDSSESLVADAATNIGVLGRGTAKVDYGGERWI